MKYLILTGILGFVIFGFVKSKIISQASEIIITEKLNGMSVVSGPTDVNVEHFQAINNQSGSDWVAILPYAFSRLSNPAVHYNSERQWWGETVEGTYSYVSKAQEAGLKVMIKPQIWVPNSWTGGLSYSTVEEWELWESDYEDFILDYAIVADSTHADMLCIGTELKLSTSQRPQFWIDLVPKIKAIYDGPLTYASNWDNFENIPIWDQLDYIGVDAYFPLSESNEPSVEELITAWNQPFKSLKKISSKYQKPLLFTEFGYLAVDGAAGKAWELEKNRRARVHNQKAQCNAYEALFQKFWTEPWFGGGFAWKWHPTMTELNERRKNDYTPQGKDVLETFKNWYNLDE